MEVNYSVELLRRDREQRVHVRRELLRIKIEFAISGQVLLELGCGVGDNFELFSGDNRVLGIEGLEAAVQEARSLDREVLLGDLESPLELQTASVDWVICLDVLEHLVNPLGALQEMSRVLKPNGCGIINVPNHFDVSGRLKLLFGHDLDVHGYFPQNQQWNNPHLRFFTHQGICALIGVAGFEIAQDRSGYFPSFPKLDALRGLGVEYLLRPIARLKPSVFAAGFLLVIRKPSAAEEKLPLLTTQ